VSLFNVGVNQFFYLILRFACADLFALGVFRCESFVIGIIDELVAFVFTYFGFHVS
jgi:hypothetical protein